MALPLAAVAGKALVGGAGRAAAGGAVRTAARRPVKLQGLQLENAVDFKPFEKAMEKLKKQLSPKVNDKQMLDLTRLIAGRILGQAANNTGVTTKRGKFSKSLGTGRAHIKKKYTWPKPATRGKNKGRVKPVYESAVKSIKYNGKVYTFSAWATGTMYFRKSFYGKIIPVVEKGLKKAKNRALKRLGSGKAAWYSIAKAHKLPVSSFKDKGQLGVALRAVTGRYKNAIRSKEINRSGRVGIEFTNAVFNSVNPHTRGLDAFRRSVKGQSSAVNVLIRKGYITSIKKAFANLKHTAK